MKQLREKVAFVTGAAHSLGRAARITALQRQVALRPHRLPLQ